MKSPILVRAVLAVVLVMSASRTVAADAIEGKWLGTAGAPNNRSVFGLEITRDDAGKLAGAVTLVELNYYGAKLPEIRDAGGGKIAVPAFGLELTLAGDELSGHLSDGAAVSLRRSDRLPVDPPVPADLPRGPGPRWQTKLGSAIFATAAVQDGFAYVGTVGGVFQAVSLKDGAIAWTFSAGRPVFGEALATDDAVYFVCDNGFLFRLARDTGKEVWRYNLGDGLVSRILPHPQVYDYDYQAPRPTLADGVIYVGAGDGGCHAVKAADGSRVWRIAAKGKVRTDAAVNGNQVVFTTDAGLVIALEAATGRELWKKEYPAPVTSSPVFIGDKLIVGGRDSVLRAVNPANGESLWRLGFWGSWVESTPVPQGDDRFLLGSSDLRRVGLYSANEARILWRTDVFGWAWGRPLPAGGRVYVGTGGAKPYEIRHVAALAAFDAVTGRILWRWPLDEPAGEYVWGFAASPARGGDTVVIGAINGTLYGFPAEL